MQLLVKEEVLCIKADLDETLQKLKQMPADGGNSSGLVTPRLDALEKRMQLLVKEEALCIKGDIDAVQQKSKEWVHSLTKHTEHAVSSLQQQIVNVLAGGGSPSVMTSSRRSASPQSRHRSRSGSDDEEEEIRSSASRATGASDHRDSCHKHVRGSSSSHDRDEERSQSSRGSR